MRIARLLLAAPALWVMALPAAAQPAAVQPAAAQAATPATTVSARAAERVERHIGVLHQRLSITPAQEPQWQAFAVVMRDNARGVEEGHATNQPQPPGNAVEQLRSLAARARLHADNLARLLPPFDALYASLSPEQRAVADKTFSEFQRGAGGPTRP